VDQTPGRNNALAVKYEPGETYIMKKKGFDLNDIQHEPTDAQLEDLMNAVVSNADRRARKAKSALMQRLHDDIVAARLAHD